jgi:Holliday junction resolvase RusA-like endonuclease
MQIRIDESPLSVNKAWKGQRFKTDAYKNFEKKIYYLLPNKKLNVSDLMRIELFFGFSSKASDLDNPVKMILDILQKKYGINDKNVYELNIRKCIVDKGKEFIEIGIYDLLPFK